ncbi:MAG TPA: glycosyltransferase, partial [Candidatus Binataceae bacterium]|nr:glycosyltransferase [Candidatus Binataceae bacterium]
FHGCPRVTLHQAIKPAGSFYLGHLRLNRLGRAVAAEVTARDPHAHVVINGGNCAWPGINWMHCVHRAWKPCDCGAPLWFRLKNRLGKARARRDERRCVAMANRIVANSNRTRNDIIERLGVAPERVTAVYLGIDDRWRPITTQRRAEARAALGLPVDRPLIAFVGALGHDSNKGFDTLWAAWRRLCAQPDWNANLIAAGGGRAVARWRSDVARAGLDGRTRMLGFVENIGDVLAASDLLVSPVRYESYGLNVHEAICCGIPAIVSESAGVAERFSSDLRELLLHDPEDASELAALMLRWRANMEGFRQRIEPLAVALRARTWDEMAADIVALADDRSPVARGETAFTRRTAGMETANVG